MRRLEPPTGHVFRRDGTRRSTWYAKYRLPDGRQVQKRIGPAWTGRGRPPAGHFTKRTAEDWLRQVLDEARRGTLPGLVRTGAEAILDALVGQFPPIRGIDAWAPTHSSHEGPLLRGLDAVCPGVAVARNAKDPKDAVPDPPDRGTGSAPWPTRSSRA